MSCWLKFKLLFYIMGIIGGILWFLSIPSVSLTSKSDKYLLVHKDQLFNGNPSKNITGKPLNPPPLLFSLYSEADIWVLIN